MEFTVLFRDTHYVAIYKPANMLVHRTPLANDTRFVLQELRNQLRQRLYPVHRLDRATAGVLLFAFSSAAAEAVARQFREQQTHKIYWAIVRGWITEPGSIDHPVKVGESAQRKPAVTHYRPLATVELPYPVDRYPTSRYSLLEIEPKTGRQHQIRQHLKHISHHLIGDTSYGNGKHNQFFRDHFNIHRMLLLAKSLEFIHPYTGQITEISATPDPEWRILLEQLGWLSCVRMPRPPPQHTNR